MIFPAWKTEGIEFDTEDSVAVGLTVVVFVALELLAEKICPGKAVGPGEALAVLPGNARYGAKVPDPEGRK